MKAQPDITEAGKWRRWRTLLLLVAAIGVGAMIALVLIAYPRKGLSQLAGMELDDAPMLDALRSRILARDATAVEELSIVEDTRVDEVLLLILQERSSRVQRVVRVIVDRMLSPLDVQGWGQLTANLELAWNYDSGAPLRSTAAASLGNRDCRAAVDALRIATEDPYGEVRAAAAVALAQLLKHDAKTLLLNMLDDEESGVFEEVCRALAISCSVDELIELSKDEKSLRRTAAATALQYCTKEHVKVVQVLTQLLQQDRADSVCEAAVGSLSRMAGRDPDVLAALAHALATHRLPMVRAIAADSIWDNGHVLQLLRRAVKSDSSPLVRKVALLRLAELKVPDTFDICREALEDSSSDVRFHAASTLTDLDDWRVLPLLKKRIKQESDAHLKLMMQRHVQHEENQIDNQVE